jgi:hypothetical protein
MKIAAYIPLHYGKEYLEVSILSYVNLVDEIHVLYSQRPSYGFMTNLYNPDSKEELYQIATDTAKNKLFWTDIVAGNEGEHRGYGQRLAYNNDIVFTSDADEVWFPEKLESSIKTVYDDKIHKTFGVSGKIDLWRSFNWQMIDWFTPVRFSKGTGNGMLVIECPYLHMGYSQSKEVIKYKLDIHGHKSEILSLHGSIESYLQKVMDWNPETNTEDCYHPASRDIWKQAVPFDKTIMPKFMQNHINYNKVLI